MVLQLVHTLRMPDKDMGSAFPTLRAGLPGCYINVWLCDVLNLVTLQPIGTFMRIFRGRDVEICATTYLAMIPGPVSIY